MIAESPDWIVVNKPAHLLVHPSKPGNPPTLLDGLQQLLIYELATGGQISIMNRLDRETSGIVLVAKHAGAATRLARAKERNEFTKIYRAIVHGHPARADFEIDAPILRKGEVSPSEIYVRQAVHPGGVASITKCRVLDRFDKAGAPFSLLECELITGRTHQIRVHLESVGHPLVGDKIYGHSGRAYLDFIKTGWTEALEAELLLNRQALHAAELIWQDWHWKAPFPDDLAEFLKK